MKSVDELTDQFRTKGLKVTPQRQAIFRALGGSTVHPTAESIYSEVSAEMPTISLRTVYQTLNDLAAMGELHRLDIRTGSTRFDPNLDPHHHLVCDVCGLVIDVPVGSRVPAPKAGAAIGFEVTDTEIVFRGCCADCRRGAPVSSTQHQGGATAHG